MFEIDWRQSWLQGFKVHGQAVMQAWQQGGSLCVALNQHTQTFEGERDEQGERGEQALNSVSEHTPALGALSGWPFFVPQAQLPPDQAYESFIYSTHCVPTRENLHDFFNALCWLRFPRTKSYLNAEQAQSIERAGSVAARGSLRDALTLLDENACFVWCSDEMWHSLKEHRWLDVFWHQRAKWSEVRVELFGHALLEKLCSPYKAITAHAIKGTAPCLMGSDAQLDDAMLSTLKAHNLSKKPFQALPILGVPGWFEENMHRQFYEDVQVFRPAKNVLERAQTRQSG